VDDHGVLLVDGVLMTACGGQLATGVIVEIGVEHDVHGIGDDLGGGVAGHAVLEEYLLLQLHLPLDTVTLYRVVDDAILYVLVFQLEAQTAALAYALSSDFYDAPLMQGAAGDIQEVVFLRICQDLDLSIACR
jgi:hypothetical protein